MRAPFRWSARGAAFALLLASALLTCGSSASAAPRARPVSRARTRYARIRRICPSPAPGHAACFALLRVPVASNVAASVGAKPYVLDDGASESGPAGGLTPAQLAAPTNTPPAKAGTDRRSRSSTPTTTPRSKRTSPRLTNVRAAGLHGRGWLF